MRLLSAYCALLFLGCGLEAQSVVTTEVFFARSAMETAAFSGPGTAPATVKMPWVERYELRTETRDFEVERQEYVFRLTPSTRRKVRAQEALYRHQSAAPDFDGAEAACDLVADRYQDWMTMFALTEELNVLDTLALVYEDRATVLDRLAAGLDFDWSKLIRLRKDRTELKIRRKTLTDRLALLQTAYGLAGRKLDFGDVVRPGRLLARVSGSSIAPVDAELAYELTTVARELELERAERRQFLDFAQIKYQGPHGDLPRERLSVGVGLQLPNDGNQLLKVRELELEAEALRTEGLRDRAAATTSFADRKTEWLTAHERYGFVAGAFNEERADLARVAAQLQKKEMFDPLPLLDIRSRELRNALRLLALKNELYEDYLSLEERRGALCAATAGELLR